MGEEILGLSARRLTDKQLNQVLLAVQYLTGDSYVKSYEAVDRGLRTLGGDPTVFECLSAVGISADEIVDDLRTLDAASQTKDEFTRKAERSLKTLDAGQGDARQVGNVPIDDNTFGSVMSSGKDPDWVRYRRMTRTPGGEHFSSGPEGPSNFRDLDRQHALAGADIVATRERDAGTARVAQAARAQANRLDAAIARGETSSRRRVLLSQAISAGRRELDTVLGDVEDGLPVESPQPVRQGPMVGPIQLED